jgi:prevent-host-death family protein
MNKNQVGIADLKAHLSEYIARARAGERVVICDRRKPVAELCATSEPEALEFIPAELPWATVIDIPKIDPLPEIDLVALLVEDRRRR